MKKRFLFWGTAITVLASLAFIGCKKKCASPDAKPPFESKYSFEYRGATYEGFIAGTINKSDSSLEMTNTSVNQFFRLRFRLGSAKPDMGTYQGAITFSSPVGASAGKVTVVISQVTDSTAIGTFSGTASDPSDVETKIEKGNFSVRIEQ